MSHDSKGRENLPCTRRRFLRLSGIGLATPLIVPACADDDESALPEPEPGQLYFPQSVASGDPKPDSVILWSRVEDESSADHDVRLDVATDEAFDNLLISQDLVATGEYDHVLKLRLSGLEPATYYYYRFVYLRSDGDFTSNTGRTKTAPTAGADVPVRFAFVSCQDYTGRYYHSYAKMLELADELDFFVHLGDYIYETTGDPSFQTSSDTRNVAFSAPQEALAFNDDDGNVSFYAAQSLGNYRDLYKIYRADPWLQQVHERIPMIAIWDDHEFSDDSWKDTATYTDGTTDETAQNARRLAAEQAHIECMPTALGIAPDTERLAIDGLPFTDPSTVLYRDFAFGQHLHLLVTDTRTYRPDHAIAEDAFFGTIVLDQDELEAAGFDPLETTGTETPVYAPYVDLNSQTYASYKEPLVAALSRAYLAAGGAEMTDDRAQALATQATDRLMSAESINTLLEGTELAAIETATLPRGVTVDHLRFEAGLYFSVDGLHSRYLVREQLFFAMQAARYTKDPGSQDILGAAQESWLRDRLQASTATWRVVGNSITMASMVLDVRDEAFPESLVGDPLETDIRSGASLFQSFFNERFLINVDQWDGFPDKRNELIDMMSATPNVVLLSGDIHSSYVTNLGAGTGGNNVFEFTCTSVSSESFKGFVRDRVDAVVPGAGELAPVVALIDRLEEFLKASNEQIVDASNETNGFTTIEVDGNALTAVLYAAPESHTLTDLGDDVDAARAAFETTTFTIRNNELTAG